MIRSFDVLLRILRGMSMLALVLMMAVTVVDVAMRMLLNELVLGSVEVVQLMLVAVVFLALPETFRRDSQITVDVIDELAGPLRARRFRVAAAIITALVMLVMAWRVIPPAIDTIFIGDLTSDLQISLFWYWLPLVIGVVCAALAALLAAVVPPPDGATNVGESAAPAMSDR